MDKVIHNIKRKVSELSLESRILIITALAGMLFSFTATILQGIFCGFFTNWGFFKHKWLLWKWILTFLLIPCTGIGGIGQLFAVIEKVEASGFKGGFSDGGVVLLFISLQILIMLIMIGISVLKPIKIKQPLT